MLPIPDELSQRELEVLRLLAAGKSNRDIADALFISLNTVATHVRNILTKTGCANRTEAAAMACATVFLSPSTVGVALPTPPVGPRFPLLCHTMTLCYMPLTISGESHPACGFLLLGVQNDYFYGC